jgi:hypothetical protein
MTTSVKWFTHSPIFSGRRGHRVIKPLLLEKQFRHHMPPRPAAFGVRQCVTYRPRDLPIISFANKLDHQGRDPFDLLDEIEQSLAVDVTLASFFVPRHRQNHIDQEIAAVWQDDFSSRAKSQREASATAGPPGLDVNRKGAWHLSFGGDDEL